MGFEKLRFLNNVRKMYSVAAKRTKKEDVSRECKSNIRSKKSSSISLIGRKISELRTGWIERQEECGDMKKYRQV